MAIHIIDWNQLIVKLFRNKLFFAKMEIISESNLYSFD